MSTLKFAADWQADLYMLPNWPCRFLPIPIGPRAMVLNVSPMNGMPDAAGGRPRRLNEASGIRHREPRLRERTVFCSHANVITWCLTFEYGSEPTTETRTRPRGLPTAVLCMSAAASASGSCDNTARQQKKKHTRHETVVCLKTCSVALRHDVVSNGTTYIRLEDLQSKQASPEVA